MDILHIDGLLKQRSDVVGRESGDATADGRDEKRLFGMRLGIDDELVDVRTDRLYPTLHGRDGIALTLRAVAIAKDSTEIETRRPCGTATVHPGEVTAENENLVGLE